MPLHPISPIFHCTLLIYHEYIHPFCFVIGIMNDFWKIYIYIFVWCQIDIVNFENNMAFRLWSSFVQYPTLFRLGCYMNIVAYSTVSYQGLIIFALGGTLLLFHINVSLPHLIVLLVTTKPSVLVTSVVINKTWATMPRMSNTKKLYTVRCCQHILITINNDGYLHDRGDRTYISRIYRPWHITFTLSLMIISILT